MWKSTEFIVLPHRDSKDVFILGGTDDIQVLLDDSQVSRERKGKGRRGGEREEGEGIKRIRSSFGNSFSADTTMYLCACKHFSHSLAGEYLHHSRLSARGTHQVQGGRVGKTAQPLL